LCISWINKRLYSIKMHGTTVKKKKLIIEKLIVVQLVKKFSVD